MKDSLQYGIPGAMFLFGLLAMQLHMELFQLTVVRWIVGLLIIQVFALMAIRGKSHGNYPFRIVWFSGFNVSFVSILIFLMLGMLMTNWLSGLGNKELAFTFSLHTAVIEFFGLMTVGVLTNTLLAYLLKK